MSSEEVKSVWKKELSRDGEDEGKGDGSKLLKLPLLPLLDFQVHPRQPGVGSASSYVLSELTSPEGLSFTFTFRYSKHVTNGM